MCMRNPERIESKDVPKHAYKVYLGIYDNKKLATYYQCDIHNKNKFNKSSEKKKSHKTITCVNSALHFGRISVFENEIDAIHFCEKREYSVTNLYPELWKVEIKQTTKYAYRGTFQGKTLAVDQVKPIKRVC